MRIKLSLLVLIQLIALWLGQPIDLLAETSVRTSSESRARFSTQSKHIPTSALPVKLPGGSTLTLISPQKWDSLSANLLDTLQEQHKYFSDLFGSIPPFTVTLLLMTEQDFFESTGAPTWTTALFYRGRIIIPLSDAIVADNESLVRSIKHEYTHAVVHALTSGKCPGWIDEGLAQWAEGAEHPALSPALLRWLNTRSPVPLALLQNGFTKLNSQVVAPAYAQSYFATRLIIAEKGFEALGHYFHALHTGKPSDQAFKLAFGMEEQIFEQLLRKRLKEWQNHSVSNHQSPIKVSELFFVY